MVGLLAVVEPILCPCALPELRRITDVHAFTTMIDRGRGAATSAGKLCVFACPAQLAI